MNGFLFISSNSRILFKSLSKFRELLTPQQHYDWGLRALKTVLKGCGDLLQSSRKSDSSGVDESKESTLVVQALRLNTLSKLTFSDSKRFDALVRDVFPGVELHGIIFEHLVEALNESAKELNIILTETQVWNT